MAAEPGSAAETEATTLGNWLNISERQNVRHGFAYLIRRYETIDACAAAIEMSVDAIKKAMWARRAQSYRLACILARAADVPVEKILTGLWPGDRLVYRVSKRMS